MLLHVFKLSYHVAKVALGAGQLLPCRLQQHVLIVKDKMLCLLQQLQLLLAEFAISLEYSFNQMNLMFTDTALLEIQAQQEEVLCKLHAI